ncbi:MAG: Trk system potassium transporter TrkA [Clostridia bacterium]|nr:Trk system potassium transporter TrkA [Clostridia bacterium]
MNIVIIGNGKVGGYLAEQLLRDKHQITVIDNDPQAIAHNSDALDVMFVEGSGTNPSTLLEAHIDECDLSIAVTGSDEVNMICSLLSKSLGAKYTIARVRDFIYSDDIAILKRELKLDMIINPENITAREIARMIQFPQACDVESFYRGKIDLASVRIEEKDFLAGCQVSSVMKKLNNVRILFCVVERGTQTFIPNGSFIFNKGDKLHIIGDVAALNEFFKVLGRYTTKVRNVMITGGGRIAYYLTKQLHKLNINTKIIEIDPERCRTLSESLKATIICGDGTEQEILESELLSRSEAFISLTNRDEDNLITALYAIQSGVPKVIAKNNRQQYSDIVQRIGLDGIVSPKVITGNYILQCIRGMDNSVGSEMRTLYKIANNRAEVMEFLIGKEAKHLGVSLKELPICDGILIAAIIRSGKLIIPDGDTCIRTGDSVIVVSTASGSILQLNDIFYA